MGALKVDPYLWSALAALFAGLSLGQVSRWASTFFPRARTRRDARSKRARRWTRAVAFFALALLPATAILVFPAKASLSVAALLPWSAAVLALGALMGAWPKAAGIPIALLVVAFFVGLGAGLSGWLAFKGPGLVASLLPLDVVVPQSAAEAPSFRGELELAERDSVPIAQRIEMQSSEVALVAESIELAGPLGLAAKLARSGSSGRFYRVVGLVSPNAPPTLFPSASTLLGRVAALGSGEGFEPGAAPAMREALWGLFTRRRSASPSARLVVLEPLRFYLGEGVEPKLDPFR